MKIIQYGPEHFEILREAAVRVGNANLCHRPFVDYYYGASDWCKLYLFLSGQNTVLGTIGVERMRFLYGRQEIVLGFGSNLNALMPGVGGYLFRHWTRTCPMGISFGGSEDFHRMLRAEKWTYLKGVRILHLNKTYKVNPGEASWRVAAKWITRHTFRRRIPAYRSRISPGVLARVSVQEETTYRKDLLPLRSPFQFRFAPSPEYLSWRYSTSLPFTRYRLFRILADGRTSGYVIINEGREQLLVSQCDGEDPETLAYGVLLSLVEVARDDEKPRTVQLSCSHPGMQRIYESFGLQAGSSERPLALSPDRRVIDSSPDITNWLINFDWGDNGLRAPFLDQTVNPGGLASKSKTGLKAASGVAARGVKVDVYSASEWSEVAPIWSKLVQQSPYSSFFLTLEWTESWLEVFGDLIKPEILVFRDNGRAVGVCLLVSRRERRGPFTVRRIYLNTSGEDEIELTNIEFNNILCRAGWERPVSEAFAGHLRTESWDEIAANGFCQGTMLETLEEVAFSGLIRTYDERPSPYVDLACLRESNLRWEDMLSANTRSNIRRYKRQYEKMGAVSLQVASDVPQALQMFDQLREMHQKTWTARGMPGAFFSSRKVTFHQSLIRRAFPHGFIQLLRVTAGNEIIGILYNFVWRGKVYFMQSGMCYSPDHRMHPGFVTFACAIPYCLEQGLKEFDFLAGEQRYKESMSTDSRKLFWIVFQKPNIKIRTIEFLRSVKHRLCKRDVETTISNSSCGGKEKNQ